MEQNGQYSWPPQDGKKPSFKGLGKTIIIIALLAAVVLVVAAFLMLVK